MTGTHRGVRGAALCTLLLLTACSSGGPSMSEATDRPATPAQQPDAPSSPSSPSTSSSPSGRFTRVPSAPPVDAPAGQPMASVPPRLWTAIRSDLADRKVAAERAKLVSARVVMWNDGSLGCPEPGQAYTQAIVPGHQVVVSVDGVTYDYRFGRGDRPVLCTRPAARGGTASPRA